MSKCCCHCHCRRRRRRSHASKWAVLSTCLKIGFKTLLVGAAINWIELLLVIIRANVDNIDDKDNQEERNNNSNNKWRTMKMKMERKEKTATTRILLRICNKNKQYNSMWMVAGSGCVKVNCSQVNSLNQRLRITNWACALVIKCMNYSVRCFHFISRHKTNCFDFSTFISSLITHEPNNFKHFIIILKLLEVRRRNKTYKYNLFRPQFKKNQISVIRIVVSIQSELI